MDVEPLLELERSGWESLCNGTGGDFYGRIMTDDAVMVLANGEIMTREQVVVALSEAPAWASYDIDDPRVVWLGADDAALVYVGTGRRTGDDPPFVGAMTSVYVRVAGEWRLAVYQQTAVATG